MRRSLRRETVTYVSNIYKYYVAYRPWTDQRVRRAGAKTEIRSRKPPHPHHSRKAQTKFTSIARG
jgi:hypothetical protein